MRLVRLTPHQARPAPLRLVCLPGAAMSAADIAAQGWGADLQVRGLRVDMDALDLQAQRLDGADAIDRLAAEVLRPARDTGARVWLAGISLGGWQAVLCAARHPGLVDGLCLLSPYPGDRLAWQPIERAGGLDAWVPEAGDDPALAVWAWWRCPAPNVAVWMGYGLQDRFADGMARMAARLPAHAVQRIEGGHDWACWRRLWQHFLDNGVAWPARAGAAPA